MTNILTLTADDRKLLAQTPLLNLPRAHLLLIAQAAGVKSRRAEERMRTLAAAGLVQAHPGNRYVLRRTADNMPTLHHYGIVG